MFLFNRCPQSSKTFSLLTAGSLVSVFFAGYIQNRASQTVSSCSYLDPVLIDVVALIAGFFLIVEGVLAIFRQRNIFWAYQLTRILRVCLGCSITTIHILQFIHK